MVITYMSKEIDTKNAKYVDLLDEDKPLAGQKFVCVSFVSPENIVKQKRVFFFEEFLKHYEFAKSLEKFKQFLHFLSYKYNLEFDNVMKDLTDFAKSEKESLATTTIPDEYKNFIDSHEERLDKDFSEICNFQTSTRGLKIRGSFPSQEEAELRAKMLRETDPNHDVYVGPVGLWMPWEPEAYKTGRVEYLEEELNTLMSEKMKNEEKAKQQFEARVKDAKRKAIEENIKLAKESGTKLSQSITEDGELIGIKNMSTTETTINATNEIIRSADIRKELFEGEHIRTKETDKEYEKNKKNKK